MHNESIATLAAALKAKKISSIELTTLFLERIKKFDKNLNSFITVTEDLALAKAKEADQQREKNHHPLAGIPFAHKDIFCTEGVKTSCGSKMLDNFIAPYDATIVSKMKKAGMVMLGKTNMDEFAMGSSNENSFYGAVKNPWNTKMVSGGSSGGSAASVAARLTPASTGTDTGGSIRQPAGLCGLTGLKPTYGRVSRFGMIAFASSLDQAGPMAKSAEDCALLLNVMAGFDEHDSTSVDEAVPDYTQNLANDLKGIKIGLPKEYFTKELDSQIANTLQQAIKEYEKLGASFVEISLPNTHLSIPAYYVVAPAECSSNLSRFDGVRFGHRCDNPKDLLDLYQRSRGEGFGKEVIRRILTGTYVLSSGYYDAYYLQAQKIRHLIRDDFVKAFEKVDVILGPTSPTLAFPIGEKSNDPVSMYLADIYTISTNLAGLPGMSIPAGFSNTQLPIGLQLIGNYFDEAKLLNIAHRYQQVTDWHLKMPRVFKMQWETVIGLEVHVQLLTKSKLFSGAPTAYGAAPNTQACSIDLGLPGVLPVLNQEAVRMAIKFGLSIGAEITSRSVFARKNYFYPDLPKGYQISQFELPVVGKGHMDIALENNEMKRVGITRAHLEEDAGKSLHDALPGMTGIDLNRAGTPLLEIVSEPDLRSAKEAVAYLKTLHALVRYLEICDGNMQEGSFRCDANVSVRRPGEPFGTRAEIKNINSFRFVEKAINYEVERQIDLIESGGKVVQETRLYNADKDETRSMRSKEDAQDYRYFPDPDLLPLVIDKKLIEDVSKTLPELPQQKRERFQAQYGLSAYDANILSTNRETASYFEQAVIKAPNSAKLIANWMMGELSYALNKNNLDINASPINSEQLAALVSRIADNTISNKIAKTVFDAMWETGKSADEIIKEQGLTQVTDSSAISAVIEKVMQDFPEQLADYRSGKDKLFGFFVGQVMKASGGKVNPQQLNDLLKEKLK